MASARYDKLIEEIKNETPEEKRIYTKKEKRKNFWHYYKLPILAGAVVLALVGSFIVSVVTRVHPDYTIGMIKDMMYPQQLLDALEANLATLADDRNGDGKVVVKINSYQLSFTDSAEKEDPNMRMANMTRLMGDLQTCETMIFLTSEIKDIQEGEAFLGYNDGTYPAEGESVDYSRMGVLWKDAPVLASLPLGEITITNLDGTAPIGDGQLFMQDLYLVMRAYDNEKPDSKTGQYYTDSLALFQKMIAQ